MSDETFQGSGIPRVKDLFNSAFLITWSMILLNQFLGKDVQKHLKFQFTWEL